MRGDDRTDSWRAWLWLCNFFYLYLLRLPLLFWTIGTTHKTQNFENYEMLVVGPQPVIQWGLILLFVILQIKSVSVNKATNKSITSLMCSLAVCLHDSWSVSRLSWVFDVGRCFNNSWSVNTVPEAANLWTVGSRALQREGNTGSPRFRNEWDIREDDGWSGKSPR